MQLGKVAQGLEHRSDTAGVEGSIPSLSMDNRVVAALSSYLFDADRQRPEVQG